MSELSAAGRQRLRDRRAPFEASLEEAVERIEGAAQLDAGAATRMNALAKRLAAVIEPPLKKAKKATSDWWCSPPEITEPLAEFFGGPVDVDPCSNPRSLVQARRSFHRGGLVLPWRYAPSSARTVYQNDPYSQAAPWTSKALHEIATGNVVELVRLSMMSTSTQWWEDMCNFHNRNPRILGLRRLAFLDPDAHDPLATRESCRFEPALTYFGPRTLAFTRAFAHLTRWSTWGR